MHLTLIDVQAAVNERNRVIAKREREALLLGEAKIGRKRTWPFSWLVRRTDRHHPELAPRVATA